MTADMLSTALLSLTGPIAALALAAVVLTLRPLAGAGNVWTAVWLTGLGIRFGKSTLNALFGLEPWALNLGLAGMATAPAALYLMTKSAEAVRRDHLTHLLPAVVLLAGSPWIPNARGDSASAFIYVSILAIWVGYIALTWRALASPVTHDHPDRGLLRILCVATTTFGALFIAVFAGATFLYLVNAVLFSATIILIAVRLMTQIHLQKRTGRRPAQAATAEQIALVERVRAALVEPDVLSDLQTNLVRVARRLGVAQKTISTAVNAATNDSFTTLLNTIRLAEARRRLASTNESIEEIAASCGFSSASAFHRTFRRHMNDTPAAWRTAKAHERATDKSKDHPRCARLS